jgi:hypothetical protein
MACATHAGTSSNCGPLPHQNHKNNKHSNCYAVQPNLTGKVVGCRHLQGERHRCRQHNHGLGRPCDQQRGAATAAPVVVASVVETTSVVASTTMSLLEPLLVPTLIAYVRRRTRDGKMLNGQGLKHWRARLCGLLCEGQCRHLLQKRGNMLIQRLLVRRDCINCRREFLGGRRRGSLVSITQSAACSCRSCSVHHRSCSVA